MIKSKAEIKDILDILADKYPNPETELNYETPFQLLIATILSAQSTDKQVNKVTIKLFERYREPKDFIDMTIEELAKKIQGVGLYRNKAKYIIDTCHKLVEEYDSQVPTTRKELMRLSGVGRKTANVVLSCAFGHNAIAVDTHVFRVANRLGIASSKTVEKTEKDLMEKVPKNLWSAAHHWFIFHGREVCKARKPRCEECSLQKLCDYYLQT
ncbi:MULTISPECIES: endonuclease III [unclassified Candidatus Frackibacter]|uniref:endonuclease III n=1 Tax=unclassified Candidatus Frackibacter TaxID=2648818 RepID=UPI002A4E1DFB|nr:MULTISPECIES: endonuclease III [unclassified Candidatus Frackibacter]